jgi:hypothetical protein
LQQTADTSFTFNQNEPQQRVAGYSQYGINVYIYVNENSLSIKLFESNVILVQKWHNCIPDATTDNLKKRSPKM